MEWKVFDFPLVKLHLQVGNFFTIIVELDMFIYIFLCHQSFSAVELSNSWVAKTHFKLKSAAKNKCFVLFFLQLLKLTNGIEAFCLSTIKQQGNQVKWFTCRDDFDNSYLGAHDDCEIKRNRQKKTINIIVFSSNRTYYAIINRNAICRNRVFKAFCRVTSKVSPLQRGAALRPMECWEAAASGEEMGSGMLTQE